VVKVNLGKAASVAKWCGRDQPLAKSRQNNIYYNHKKAARQRNEKVRGGRQRMTIIA
jgi:hypothetical protein